MNRRKVEILVSGMVQGVGFRYFVCHLARESGILGWVRNLPDGRVEIVAEGDEGQLKAFIDEIKVGPRSAVIEEVTLNWSQADSHFTSFNIR
jgi:acylphosphatase